MQNKQSSALAAHLAECDTRYSSEYQMIGRSWSSPGYHTRVPDGVWVHPTRDSLEYALALLIAGGEANNARAAGIVRKVVSLQDADPTHATYGIWSWLMEESLTEMAPPDWNWADFLGALLAQMLVDHVGQLPADLAGAMRISLGHAAWAIFRRNVGPSYTNIAVMGGCVAAAAGEILDEPRLTEYGRRRLSNIVAHAEYHGGFNEYNSPTYTMVVVRECERALQLLEDSAARAHAQSLLTMAWRTIAEHYHPATGQWAGPHSRAYSDLLNEDTRTSLLIGAGLVENDGSVLQLIIPQPCPADVAERFRLLPGPEVETVRSFIRSDEVYGSRSGTTWLADDVCLGSVAYEDFWTQRRCLIGYWRLPAGPPAVLRMRFLHDGRDFASAAGHHVQARNRVLSGLGLLTNRGDWHVHLDRPDDGVFVAEDLRVRYELVAEGASVRQVAEECFEMTAGEYRAMVHPAAGLFVDRAVRWVCGEDEGKAYVDGIYYHGEPKGFDLSAVSRVQVGAALEVLAPGEVAIASPPTWQVGTEEPAELSWPGAALALSVPIRAHESH